MSVQDRELHTDGPTAVPTLSYSPYPTPCIKARQLRKSSEMASDLRCAALTAEHIDRAYTLEAAGYPEGR